MKIAKVKFIAAVAAGVLVGVILTTAVYFSFLSSSGMRLVPAKEYRRLESMDRRYSKLWKIQNLVQKNSLKYIRVDKQMNALYRALLKSYGEPYSVYMTPEETKRFDGRLNGSYSGIGAVLEESGGQVRISRVMDKSPARSAGLKQGDVILQVNGKNQPDDQRNGKTSARENGFFSEAPDSAGKGKEISNHYPRRGVRGFCNKCRAAP
jgi:C-terminal processing protease CtpA/Prc